MPRGSRISKGGGDGGHEASGEAGRWRIEHLAEVDSTNRYALEQARAGAEPGLVVVADHQTAGRGRLDRRWEAPPGSSLLVSVVLAAERSSGAPAGAGAGHRPVVAVAVALAEAVEAVTGLVVGIKWPNDLVVGDRKLAGILAETAPDAAAVVVGAGCNVNWETFPPELVGIATACNLEVGHPVDRDALLDALLTGLGRHVADPAAAAQAYGTRLVTLGRRVRVEQPGRELVGVAVALTGDGALVVRDDTATDHVVVAGDVIHLRDVDP